MVNLKGRLAPWLLLFLPPQAEVIRAFTLEFDIRDQTQALMRCGKFSAD